MVERGPFEEDFVSGDVDLIEHRIDDPACCGASNGCKISGCDIVCCYKQSALGGDVDFVQVDVAGISCTWDLFHEVSREGDCFDDVVCIVENIDGTVSTTDWF